MISLINRWVFCAGDSEATKSDNLVLLNSQPKNQPLVLPTESSSESDEEEEDIEDEPPILGKFKAYAQKENNEEIQLLDDSNQSI